MSDCLVIGGGVIGMMSARTLVMAGASVTLLDQRECGKESSWAGGGIISPLYPWHYDDLTNELSFASQLVYADLCLQIFEDTGIDAQYLKSGLLMMDEYDLPLAIQWINKYNIYYQHHADGVLFANIAQVRNPRLLKALKVDILNKGVNIIEHIQANDLLIKDNQVIGVKTKNKDYFAQDVIVCSGAWSSKLLRLTDEVFPMKGQMIVLKSTKDVVENIVLDQGRYIIPRADGRILVGSTMENVGFDGRIDIGVQKLLHEFAYQRFPALLNAKIEYQWSGFRPASLSGKVILGKHEQFEHLLINTGHFSNGLNMAPASADKIKQLIINA
ncbi:FAD dependent oxidoreductase [Candidatus Ruthia magnifica str. Cm (Calyptogena magnifica)]|uniref:FAD dependent oxidoreductase n=1 Tax=Ruthia magnifica subsp. Calyptogena magnifica TaxID=413404 RepID=A1AWT9_RUTMC|nr:FAD-dependent oxidoreductase [Candidatus Ruthturnera calyptogenae]ABL02396.1 FAD dependent oxidoreductase [Candidatus Ruthia magnifica str. Cm (Calyptogena magnifica)]